MAAIVRERALLIDNVADEMLAAMTCQRRISNVIRIVAVSCALIVPLVAVGLHMTVTIRLLAIPIVRRGGLGAAPRRQVGSGVARRHAGPQLPSPLARLEGSAGPIVTSGSPGLGDGCRRLDIGRGVALHRWIVSTVPRRPVPRPCNAGGQDLRLEDAGGSAWQPH